jgi:5'-methylthioadenosine phosphorylase
MDQIKVGIIGGTGLGKLLSETASDQRHEVDTPFGRPSDAIVETNMDGLSVLLLNRHGAGHVIAPSHVPFRANIFALKQLGCTHIIASGAVGSLRLEMKPRDLVIPDQIIDKTSRRAGSFFEKAAVHVEFAEPFCPELRRILLEESAKAGTEDGASPDASGKSGIPNSATVHDRGCYVCMEGPAFSTRAESLMHRLWGGDLIGMTVMPEAKLAREAEIPYALVALVTDYDCWKAHAPPVMGSPPTTTTPPGPAAPVDPAALLKEILSNLQAASTSAMGLIRGALVRIAANPAPLLASPAHRALELAIWSEKSRIDPAEVQRLLPLWGKYFS